MAERYLYEPRDYRGVSLWKNVTDQQWNDPLWQRRNVIRDVAGLNAVMRLSEYQQSEIERTLKELRAQGKEAMRITPYYATLIAEDPFHPDLLPGEDGANRLDPIFWQAVPTPAHLLFPRTGTAGAMNEENRSYGAAYQRYPNRVALFVAENTSCASYCTHCQRAKSLDLSASITREEINKGLFYITANTNIDEVLVTGGDALMISLDRLKYVLEQLCRIPHLHVIRIATRVPVTLPMGVSDELLKLIRRTINDSDKYVYFMTHINHYHEITPALARAVKKIHHYGFSIRNQTVLLRHVNDNLATLAETLRRMLWVGVEPYYLLQCHREKGLIHFITPIQVGKLLIKHLQGWLSGMARPVYAVNVEGGGGKVILMPSGHDTMHVGFPLHNRVSESVASVWTWDSKIIDNYEALGRASRSEFQAAVQLMDKFIGRSGVYKPSVIIVDKKGRHLATTHKAPLPDYSPRDKSIAFGYQVFSDDLPLTNPNEIAAELDQQYRQSPH